MSILHTTNWGAVIWILRYLKDSYILIRNIVWPQRSLMLIGQVVLLVKDLPLDIVFSLAVILYSGKVKNKQLYLVPWIPWTRVDKAPTQWGRRRFIETTLWQSSGHAYRQELGLSWADQAHWGRLSSSSWS